MTCSLFYMLAHYLTLELNCKITLLGIQPVSVELNEPLSPEVECAANEAVEALTSTLL